MNIRKHVGKQVVEKDKQAHARAHTQTSQFRYDHAKLNHDRPFPSYKYEGISTSSLVLFN